MAKSIYKAVVNPAKMGYLHKDLLFSNIQLERSSDNEIIVKLINFNLVDQIRNLDSTINALDRTGIFLFMSIKILETIKNHLFGISNTKMKQHSEPDY